MFCQSLHTAKTESDEMCPQKGKRTDSVFSPLNELDKVHSVWPYIQIGLGMNIIKILWGRSSKCVKHSSVAVCPRDLLEEGGGLLCAWCMIFLGNRWFESDSTASLVNYVVCQIRDSNSVRSAVFMVFERLHNEVASYVYSARKHRATHRSTSVSAAERPCCSCAMAASLSLEVLGDRPTFENVGLPMSHTVCSSFTWTEPSSRPCWT
jgi:hypothetical protein